MLSTRGEKTVSPVKIVTASLGDNRQENAEDERSVVRVTFCWTHVSGYMLACWKQLQDQPGLKLSVLAFAPSPEMPLEIASETADWLRLLSVEDRNDPSLLNKLVNQSATDVLVLAGWSWKPYRSLVYSSSEKGRSCILGIDTPYRGSLRQRLGRLVLRSFVRRMSLVVVPGERARQLAVFYGVPPRKIRRGLYGFDAEAFGRVAAQRQKAAGLRPSGFLFVGRLEARKGIRFLLEAYKEYRKMSCDPWSLTLCGVGKLGSDWYETQGVRILGFVQPERLPRVFGDHGALVLPSIFEPWGVVIAEACASGLPVICTEACGSGVELVRCGFNGEVVPTGSVRALATAMQKVATQVEAEPGFGAQGCVLAAPYSASLWAKRWKEFCVEVGN